MSFKTCLFVLGLAVYLSDQVSSLQCYTCSTEIDDGCYANPKQSRFEKSCPNGFLIEDPIKHELISLIQNYNHKWATTQGEKCNRSSFDCGTIVAGKPGDKYHTVRACLVTAFSCDLYKSLLAQDGFDLKSCHRCGDDLCNFSNE